jgi:hypothetical protein
MPTNKFVSDVVFKQKISFAHFCENYHTNFFRLVAKKTLRKYISGNFRENGQMLTFPQVYLKKAKLVNQQHVKPRDHFGKIFG